MTYSQRTHDILAQSIPGLIAQGFPPEQAVALALAEARAHAPNPLTPDEGSALAQRARTALRLGAAKVADHFPTSGAYSYGVAGGLAEAIGTTAGHDRWLATMATDIAIRASAGAGEAARRAKNPAAVRVDVRGGYLHHPFLQVMRDSPQNRADIARWHEQAKGERVRFVQARGKASNPHESSPRAGRPPSDLNVSVLWDVMQGRTEIANGGIRPIYAPHMRRVLQAGYVTVSPDQKTITLTNTGQAAVDSYHAHALRQIPLANLEQLHPWVLAERLDSETPRASNPRGPSPEDAARMLEQGGTYRPDGTFAKLTAAQIAYFGRIAGRAPGRRAPAPRATLCIICQTRPASRATSHGGPVLVCETCTFPPKPPSPSKAPRRKNVPVLLLGNPPRAHASNPPTGVIGVEQARDHCRLFHDVQAVRWVKLEIPDGQKTVTRKAFSGLGHVTQTSYEVAQRESNKHGPIWDHEHTGTKPFEAYDPVGHTTLKVLSKGTGPSDWWREDRGPPGRWRK